MFIVHKQASAQPFLILGLLVTALAISHWSRHPHTVVCNLNLVFFARFLLHGLADEHFYAFVSEIQISYLWNHVDSSRSLVDYACCTRRCSKVSNMLRFPWSVLLFSSKLLDDTWMVVSLLQVLFTLPMPRSLTFLSCTLYHSMRSEVFAYYRTAYVNSYDASNTHLFVCWHVCNESKFGILKNSCIGLWFLYECRMIHIRMEVSIYILYPSMYVLTKSRRFHIEMSTGRGKGWNASLVSSPSNSPLRWGEGGELVDPCIFLINFYLFF